MNINDFDKRSETRPTRIYVAGPIKKGDRTENIRRGIEAGEQLHAAGYVVFIPHLNEMWEANYKHTWAEWLSHDLEWVSVCDAVYRISGESEGADLEARFAVSRGIPLFTDRAELLRDLPMTQPTGAALDFDAYQRAAARTGGRDLLPENRDKGLNCAALGLCGEAGEFADHVKKAQHHRLGIDAKRDEAMRKELGDVLWYIAHACNVMGWRMEDIAAGNVAKLRARYPEGFSPEASVAKRDEPKP